MEKWLKDADCTGCGACFSICPKGALSMEQDENHFLVPAIDGAKCVDCGLCKSVCPVLKHQEEIEFEYEKTSCYAAWSMNEEARKNSTSGGIFYELASHFLNFGGVIVGAAYNDQLKVEHILIDSVEDLPKLMKSKYVQSDTKDGMRLAKEVLAEGKKVLFCGTPCQCGGLSSYLEDVDTEGLFLVDFVCRGANAPLAYESYLEYLARKKGSKVAGIEFRYKNPSWHDYFTKVDYEDGSSETYSRYDDPYMKGFLYHDAYLRESCNHCYFKGYDRVSDLTLGDYWGVSKDLDDGKGTSLLMAHTKEAKKLLQQLADTGKIALHPSSLYEGSYKNSCVVKSVEKSPVRDGFLKQLRQGVSFEDAINQLEETKEKENAIKEKLSIILVGSDKESIRKSKESIEKSTFKNFEILEEAEVDTHSIAYHTGEFIKDAISKCSGKYIYVMPAGVTLQNENALKQCIGLLVRNDADVLMTGMVLHSESGKDWVVKNGFTGMGNGKALAKAWGNPIGELSDYTSFGNGYANKIFKKELVESYFASDVDFLLGIAENATKVYMSNVAYFAGNGMNLVSELVLDTNVTPLENYFAYFENNLRRSEAFGITLLEQRAAYYQNLEINCLKEAYVKKWRGVEGKLKEHLSLYYPLLFETQGYAGLCLNQICKEYEAFVVMEKELRQQNRILQGQLLSEQKKYKKLRGKKLVKIALKIDVAWRRFKGFFKRSK